MGKPEHGQAMAIGCRTFQPGRIKAQVHTSEQLLGFIATAGKKGGAQPLNQGFRFQTNRRTALD